MIVMLSACILFSCGSLGRGSLGRACNPLLLDATALPVLSAIWIPFHLACSQMALVVGSVECCCAKTASVAASMLIAANIATNFISFSFIEIGSILSALSWTLIDTFLWGIGPAEVRRMCLPIRDAYFPEKLYSASKMPTRFFALETFA
jgi:hypothetical protein